MSDSSALISAFLHGLAAGGMLAVAVGIARGPASAPVRLASVLAGVSIASWFVSDSPELYRAVGDYRFLLAMSYPVGGFFWLFVLTVFADMRVTPLTLAPAALLVVSGLLMGVVGPESQQVVWGARNLFSAVLAIHAAVVVMRGWRDDLVEGRRRFRAPLVTLICLYIIIEVATAFSYRFTGDPRWLMLAVGRPYGGLILAVFSLALVAAFLQVRPAMLGASRRADVGIDARAEAADRLLIEKLNQVMAAEGWRREGLTIGDLAAELEVPEHRLRRLINQRLGHRNFADFVNGHRIEAAKRRLADPAEARTTVATIAFDLGYGSLGPFNRAFRDVTGTTPTDWRRQALAERSPDLKEAS